MPYRWTVTLLAALMAGVGCGGGSEAPSPIRQSPQGVATAESRFDVATTVRRLDSLLNVKPAVEITARIDHAANAASVGDTLRPTTLFLFGSPYLAAPLLQANPRAALALPHKALVYQTPDGRALLVYTNTDYLAWRHGLEGEDTVPTARVALLDLAETVAARSVSTADTLTLEAPGIIEQQSDASVEATVRRLRSAIEQNEALSVMAVVDHAARAARADIDLSPTQLLVFGNPALGTPLMQGAPTMALDLPQKMLVYEAKDGTVRIAYNDPRFLANRHALAGQDQRLQTIADALAGLADQAAGGGG